MGMASMYLWSCNRSNKNGFVWHDLSEDDLILLLMEVSMFSRAQRSLKNPIQVISFHPIRPVGTSLSPQLNQNHHHQVSNYDSTHVGGGSRALNSADSKTNSDVRNYGSLDTVEPVKVISEKDRNIYDPALLSEIDRTMKKHADNLLHALEGVSARLSQLETRSCHLVNSVDDLKVSVGNNYGSRDGKMRQI